MPLPFSEPVSLLANVATAGGVIFAAVQIVLTKRLARTQFEDGLAGEYRRITHALPTHALIGGQLSGEEHERAFHDFYRYFELSNEQTFLALNGRVSDETWKFWSDGITMSLSLPAFEAAWKRLEAVLAENQHPRFEELKQFISDPMRFEKERRTNRIRVLSAIKKIWRPPHSSIQHEAERVILPAVDREQLADGHALTVGHDL